MTTPKPSLITLLALTLLFANPAASLARWPITSMSDINKPAEKAMIDWIKKFTVPNTKRGDGSSWTLSNLPSWVNANYASRGIKPNAWAAAIVTSWSLSEGIFNVGDFYRFDNVPDKRCPFFAMPPQLPPTQSFPIAQMSYSLCQGKAYNPNPSTGQTSLAGSCNCRGTSGCPGMFIGPNQICEGACSSCWQNGIFGVEMSNVPSAADAASRAVNIYRAIGRTNPLYADALENVLITAGFPSGTAVYKTVMGCVPVNPATGRRDRAASDLSLPCAHLVRTWLLRHHLVALTYGMVDNPSFNGQNAPRSVQEAIRVLAEYFNS